MKFHTLRRELHGGTRMIGVVRYRLPVRRDRERIFAFRNRQIALLPPARAGGQASADL